MNHSIIFPLPLGIHIGFVVISVILLILCYAKRKHKYELFLLIGIASTMLIYIADTKPVFYILGLEEIIIFILAVIDMIKVSKQAEANEKAAEEKNNNTSDDCVNTSENNAPDANDDGNNDE